MKKIFVLAALGLLLAGCATQSNDGPPVDPASCSERDFDVYFEESGATTLSPEAREVIDAAKDSVRGCRIEAVRIVGLSDARADEETSEEISIGRAQAIADYLERTTSWPRSRFELLATGERGAVTEDGLNRPMRRRGRVVIRAVAP